MRMREYDGNAREALLHTDLAQTVRLALVSRVCTQRG